MTRDIQERLEMFGADVEVKRVALTMDQIDLYNPPPNPTKLTDARATGYIQEYGHECWELDALEPKIITSLIQNEVTALMDEDLFTEMEHKEEVDKPTFRISQIIMKRLWISWSVGHDHFIPAPANGP